MLALLLLQAATTVTQIYPSGDVVPANLLRIYVHFSAAMTRNDIAKHIHLFEEGRPVEQAFLEMEDGLWDPDAHRLTLFFHPGRIKRGLALHDRLGPPLKPGLHYRLVVSKEAADANGVPLAADASKEFTAGPEDRDSPNPKRWTVHAPRAGTREPLIVTAEKPLDRALFSRLLRVEDSTGRAVAGDAVVEAGETVWRFAPQSDWRASSYALRVAAELEDLAGNRPGRLFDETAAPNGGRAMPHDVVVRFQIVR